jgi:hypothetical protein
MSGSPCLLAATSRSLPEDRPISPTVPPGAAAESKIPKLCLREEKRASGQIEGLNGVFWTGFPLWVWGSWLQHLAGLSRSLDKGRSGAENYREPSNKGRRDMAGYGSNELEVVLWGL